MDQNKKGNKQDYKSHQEKFIQAIKEAKKYLVLGKPTLCSDKAYKAVQEAKDQLGGENSVQLMPGLLTVAEGYIEESMQIQASILANEERLNQTLEQYEAIDIQEQIKQEKKARDDKLSKADNNLIASFWNFLRLNKNTQEGEDSKQKNQQNISDEEVQTLKCNLHKVLGKLRMAQQQFDSAKEEFQNSILYDSQKYGPSHIITALSYYQMGQVFMSKQQIQQGEAFFGKTSEIFYKFFKYYFKLQQQAMQDNVQTYQTLNEVDSLVLLEVINCCEKILSYFNNYQQDARIQVMKPILDCYRALAMMHQYEPYDTQENQDLNNSDMNNSFGEMNMSYRKKKYEDYMREASFECMNWKGDDHPKTIRLKEITDSFGDTYEPEYDEQY